MDGRTHGSAEATSPPPKDRAFRVLLGHGGAELEGDDTDAVIDASSGSTSSLLAEQGVSHGDTLVVVASPVLEHEVVPQVLRKYKYVRQNGDRFLPLEQPPPLLSSFEGVTASKDGFHVVGFNVVGYDVKLDRYDVKLDGCLPTELMQLAYLRHLDLAWNKLRGPDTILIPN